MSTIYANSGYTFEQIFSGGKLNGSEGIKQFLETRKRQFSRTLDDPNLNSQDSNKALEALHVIDDALRVLSILQFSESQKKGA